MTLPQVLMFLILFINGIQPLFDEDFAALKLSFTSTFVIAIILGLGGFWS